VSFVTIMEMKMNKNVSFFLCRIDHKVYEKETLDNNNDIQE